MMLSAGPPHPWSLEDPFLYTVKVTVDWAGQQDAFAVPHVGFRDFRINEHGYFELNGKRIFPKCTHSNVYDPVIILGTSRDMKYVTPDFARMKDAGFNMFREIMYSALPEQLDRADELGYLIYNEHQAAWMLRDASKFAVDLPGVIRRDRNHPSLVIWGLLNETPAGPVYDDRGMKHPRPAAPACQVDGDAGPAEAGQGEFRCLIRSGHARVRAAAAQVSGGYQGGRRKPAALAFPVQHTDFRVGRWIGFDIDEVIDRYRSQSQDVCRSLFCHLRPGRHSIRCGQSDFEAHCGHAWGWM